VQEVQRTQLHAICWLIEEGLDAERKTPNAER
jgi:hypothetical protein